MNDFRFYSVLKDKIESLPPSARLRQYALCFGEVDYAWGSESLAGTDCSGLLSGALLYSGYKIRTTAEGFRRGATKGSNGFQKDEVTCVFLIDEQSNVAKHMGILVSGDVVMHASGARGVTFNQLDDLIQEYEDRGCRFEVLDLDWGRVKAMDGQASGLDEDYL